MAKTRVLITGMSGLIGQVARRQLEANYEVSALNRRPVEGVECHQADIADLQAIQPAFTGKDVVVHLAAIATHLASWEDVLHHNVIGTYNVFEAARQAGVQRVVYASSGATISGCENDFPYSAIAAGQYDQVPASWHVFDHLSPPRPTGLYGCSKLWGEALARHYVDTSDLSILCIRIGAVNKEDRPLAARQFSAWCSQRDIGQMIQKCVEAPAELRFDIFYALSRNKWSYRDLSHAREVLGFVPQDDAEAYRS